MQRIWRKIVSRERLAVRGGWRMSYTLECGHVETRAEKREARFKVRCGSCYRIELNHQQRLYGLIRKGRTEPENA